MRHTIQRILRYSPLIPIIAFLGLCLPESSLAETIGKFTGIEGIVDVLHDGKPPAVAARLGDGVQQGDFVRTKSNARAEITFSDGNVVRIAQRSRVDVNEYASGAGPRQIGLPRGKIQAVVQKSPAGEAPRKFEVRTPNAIAGVRGTDFFVYHDHSVTGVTVREGSVYTYNPAVPGVQVTVPAGSTTTVSAGKAPTPPRPATQSELGALQRGVSGGTSGNSSGSSSGEQGGETTAGSPLPGVDSETLATMGDQLQKSDHDPATLKPTNEQIQPAPKSPPVTESNPPSIQTDTTTPADTSTPAPPAKPLFSSQLNASLMSRGATLDAAGGNNLLIVNDPGISATLQGTQSLWGGSAAATLTGTYPPLPLQQPNHYWFGNLFSSTTPNHTTGDNGAYYGYFGGMSLDATGVADASLYALYIDPSGRAGIMRGALTGNIINGNLDVGGTLDLTELNAASGIDPATLAANWWDPKTKATVIELTGPSMNQKAPGGSGDNSCEGLMFDADPINLNLTGRMTNRGDVLRLSFLNADPGFGIWTRESFGTFTGSDSRYVLISNADWGSVNTATNFFTIDRMIRIASIGNWQAGGKLDGTADGVWGDWASGSIRLLTGSVTGSSNTGTSSFGAVTTGSFIDLNRFLNNPALAAQLGFPTKQNPVTFSLSGSNASGTANVGNITFFSRNAGDPISLWIAKNVNGSYNGQLGQLRVSLTDGATLATSSIFGNLTIRNAGVSPATGGNVWLGSINALGETSQTGNSFRNAFDGVAAGTFTGTTFSGSAAGLAHPVTYFNSINGATTQLRRFDGASVPNFAGIDGIMGGMSLWNSSPTLMSDFAGIGFLNPNLPLTATDYVFSAPIQSRDIPTAANMTADGGAYSGHLIAGVSTLGVGPNTPAINGVLNALYIDPSGNAGILHGSKIRGFLDTQTNIWDIDGSIYPVALGTAGGVTAATLADPGNITQTSFASSFTSFTSPTITISSAVPDSVVRNFITTTPEWGIGQFGLFSAYGNTAPGGAWDLDFLIANSGPASATQSLQGTMFGDLWDSGTGKLHANTRAGWVDMNAPAGPATGIFIGETVGTFNAASLQAMTSGTWLETNKFLQLAASAAGQATLQKLNIPAVNVGSASFSGSNASFSNVAVNNLAFFAPVNGARPQIFASSDISGNFISVPATASITLSPTGTPNGVSGITPTFAINQIGPAKWAGSISFGGAGGTVAGHNNIGFSGPAAGTISGTAFTGTTAGVVK